MRQTSGMFCTSWSCSRPTGILARFRSRENRIDEEGLTGAKSVGEITDVGPGQTKRHRFQLTPGKYAMICNVAGHYKAGMYGSVVVK